MPQGRSGALLSNPWLRASSPCHAPSGHVPVSFPLNSQFSGERTAGRLPPPQLVSVDTDGAGTAPGTADAAVTGTDQTSLGQVMFVTRC